VTYGHQHSSQERLDFDLLFLVRSSKFHVVYSALTLKQYSFAGSEA
jgi:hypothetical protein